jgi:amino acid permease
VEPIKKPYSCVRPPFSVKRLIRLYPPNSNKNNNNIIIIIHIIHHHHQQQQYLQSSLPFPLHIGAIPTIIIIILVIIIIIILDKHLLPPKNQTPFACISLLLCFAFFASWVPLINTRRQLRYPHEIGL